MYHVKGSILNKLCLVNLLIQLNIKAAGRAQGKTFISFFPTQNQVKIRPDVVHG